MAFGFTTTGDWRRTTSYLAKMSKLDVGKELAAFGQIGVNALAAATPKRSGRTAGSWYYKIAGSGDTWFISWYNSNVNEGVPIAVIIQYGHGTGSGAYIQGRDYVNPAMRPVFDAITASVWKVVTSD